MRNKKNQNAVAEGFSIVSLSMIDKSAFNPRKTFDEAELTELSLSIKEKGVIQPIVIRPIGERFEVVCGERRRRASLIAGLVDIPSRIMNLSDDDAEEFAITENLQRKDVSPLEEARAFMRLSEKGKYDIVALAAKFGKSESFIRNRMKLMQLNSLFCEMLEQDIINLGVASILASLADDVQEDIYENHFCENCPPYNSWINYRSSKLQSLIENLYSTALDKYSFNKDACMGCPFNTAAFSLFGLNESGKCLKKNCLIDKNNDFLYNEAVNLQKLNPQMSFCKDISWSTNDAVVEHLTKSGNEVLTINLMTDYSDEEPCMPVRNDFESDGEFDDAMSDYAEEKDQFTAEMEECRERIANNEIKGYIAIKTNSVGIYYAEVEIEEYEGVDSEDRPADGDSEGVSTKKMENPEIISLQKKKNRNNELCCEKIVEDQKTFIKSMTFKNEELSSLEWALLYKFLIRKIDTSNVDELGFGKEKYRIEHTDLLELNSLKVAGLIRAYLVHELSQSYLSSSEAMEQNPLRAFLLQHDADKVESIDEDWKAAYNKRNARLDERIDALRTEEIADAAESEKKKGSEEAA